MTTPEVNLILHSYLAFFKADEGFIWNDEIQEAIFTLKNKG